MPEPVVYTEFSKKIKSKYPQYKGVDDYELAQRIVDKYPQYQSQVVFNNDAQVQVQEAVRPVKKTEVPTSYTWSESSSEIPTQLEAPSYSTGGTYSAEAQDWIINPNEAQKADLATTPTSYEKSSAYEKDMDTGVDVVGVYGNVRQTDELRDYDTYLEDYFTYLKNENPERYNDDIVKYSSKGLLDMERFNLYASSLAFEGKNLQKDAEVLNARGFFDRMKTIVETGEQDNPIFKEDVDIYNDYLQRWDSIEKANRQLLVDFPDIAEKLKTKQYLNRWIEISKGGWADVDNMSQEEMDEFQQLTKDLRDRGISPLTYLANEPQTIAWNRLVDSGISMMSATKSLSELASQATGLVADIDPMKGYDASDFLMDKVESFSDDYIKMLEAERPVMAEDGSVNWYNVPSNVVGVGTDMAILLAPVGATASVLKGLGMGTRLAQGTSLFASSYANTYHDYYKQALDAGYSRDQAVRYASLTTTAVSSLELVSPNKGIQKAFTTGTGKKAMLSEVGEQLIKKNKGYKDVLNSVVKWNNENLKEVGQEASQMLAEKTVNGFSNMVMEVDNNFELNSTITRNELIETGLLTFITTGLINFGALPKGSQSRDGYLYQASLVRPEFEQHLMSLVGEGKITDVQANGIMKEVDGVEEANKSIPNEIDDKTRSEISPLIAKKKDLEDKSNNSDPVFRPMYDQQIEETNGEIADILKKNKIVETIKTKQDAKRITQKTPEAGGQERLVGREEEGVYLRDTEEGGRREGEREGVEQVEKEKEKRVDDDIVKSGIRIGETGERLQEIDEILPVETEQEEAVKETSIVERVRSLEDGLSPFEIGKEYAKTRDRYSPEEQKEIVSAIKQKQEAFKNKQVEIEGAVSMAFEEKSDAARKKISDGLEGFMSGVGLLQRAEGSEREDPIKSLGKMAQGFGELGIVKAEEIIAKLKKHVSGFVTDKKDLDKLLKYIDEKRDLILEEATPVMEKPGAKKVEEDTDPAPETNQGALNEVREMKEDFDERFKDVKKGVRIGKKIKRVEIDNIRGMFEGFIKENQERFNKIEKPLRSSMLRKVNNIRTYKTAGDAIKYFTDVMEKDEYRRSEIKKEKVIESIDKSLDIKTYQKREGDVVKGKKVDVGTQDRINDLKKYRKMSYEKALREDERLQDRIEDQGEATVDDVELSQKLRLAMLDALPLKEVERVKESIDEIVEHGREKKNERNEQRHKELESGKEEIIDAVMKGDDVLHSETATAEEREANVFSKTYRKLADTLNSFSNIHEGWKGIVETLNRTKDKDALKNTFVKPIDKARQTFNKAITDNIQLLKDKKSEFFGKDWKKKDALYSVPKFKYEAKDEDGKARKVYLSAKELANLYNMMKDDSLQPTFEKMGIQDISEDIIKDIDSMPELRRYADWLMDEFYPSMYELANETYRKVYDTNMPFNKNYTPIIREDIDQPVVDILSHKDNPASIATGRIKERRKNKNDIRLNVSLDDIAKDYLSQMGHFAAFAEPLQKISRVLLDPKVRSAIRQGNRQKTNEIIKGFLSDMTRNGLDPNKRNTTAEWFRKRFITASIGANPVVMLKQLTSFPAYAADMPTGQFTKEFGKALTSIGSKEFMKDFRDIIDSPFVKERWMKGSFDRDAALAMMSSTGRQMKKIKDLPSQLMILTRLGDMGAILMGGMPYYRYQKSQYIKDGLTESEAKSKALQDFAEKSKEAQQSAYIEDLSSIQRGGSFEQLFTMFKTSPIQYYRKTSSAVRNIARGRGTVNDAKNIFMYNVVLPALFTYVSSAFNLEDEETQGDMAQAIATTGIGGWVFMGDIINWGLDNVRGKPYAKGKPAISPVFDNLFEYIDMAVNNIDDFTLEDFVEQMLKGTEVFTGMPAEKIKRLTYDNIEKLVTGDFDSIIDFMGYSDYVLGKRKSNNTKEVDYNFEDFDMDEFKDAGKWSDDELEKLDELEKKFDEDEFFK